MVQEMVVSANEADVSPRGFSSGGDTLVLRHAERQRLIGKRLSLWSLSAETGCAAVRPPRVRSRGGCAAPSRRLQLWAAPWGAGASMVATVAARRAGTPRAELAHTKLAAISREYLQYMKLNMSINFSGPSLAIVGRLSAEVGAGML